ncbi:hypothetical protein L3V82_00265 [Thiotrichales bacterium 19S3-7]|nr:hypothetical protein [Thiotrichales bacterium 19S3-7]MCF6800597.1 hypothetical protein [Thiotrichales bacterium 19S3-11]
MKVKVIETTAKRDLAVIQGNSGHNYYFYKSTGVNSGQATSWLPWMGYFVDKPMLHMLKPEADGKVNEVIDAYNLQQTNSGLRISQKDIAFNRLGNIESLVISASIGGGMWNDEKFKAFSDYLFEKFPKYRVVVEFEHDRSNDIDLVDAKALSQEMETYCNTIAPVNRHTTSLPTITQLESLFDQKSYAKTMTILEPFSHTKQAMNDKEKLLYILHGEMKKIDLIDRNTMQQQLKLLERIASHKRHFFRSTGTRADTYLAMESDLNLIRSYLDINNQASIQANVRSGTPEYLSYQTYHQQHQKQLANIGVKN